MAGFYDVTRNDSIRKVRFRKIAGPCDAIGDAVYLADAAEAALTGAVTTMPFADLVTYPAAVVSSEIYEIAYDAAKGPLYISAQPASATVAAGDDTTFTVTAAAGPAGATKLYDWYFEGNRIAIGASNSLTVNDVSAANVGRYWVVVKATVGGQVVEEVKSKMATLALPKAVVSAVGQTQYSPDGVTWSDSIPDGVMKAGANVNFYIRTNPAALTAPDDGSYVYDFEMETVGAGGILLMNVDVNKAHIKGKTPVDQVGLTFSINCTVTDSASNQVTGTALEKDWE